MGLFAFSGFLVWFYFIYYGYISPSTHPRKLKKFEDVRLEWAREENFEVNNQEQ